MWLGLTQWSEKAFSFKVFLLIAICLQNATKLKPRKKECRMYAMNECWLDFSGYLEDDLFIGEII